MGIHTDSPHYRIRIENLNRDHHVEVELFDPPFPSRSFAVRVNGKKARRQRFATKTQVLDRLRKWMVAHESTREEAGHSVLSYTSSPMRIASTRSR